MQNKQMPRIFEEHPSQGAMTGVEARLLRERCRLSQRTLARLLGLHYMTVWKLEHGYKRITETYACRLALLAYRLRPYTRRPCPTCRGTGVVNGQT